MNNSQSLINLLSVRVNNFWETIDSEIFQSLFTEKKLRSLNLQINEVLFSSLINKKRDLRERAIKIFNIEFRLRFKHNRLVKKLEMKVDLFKNMTETAFRQKKAIQFKIKNLCVLRTVSASVRDLKCTESDIRALIKTLMLIISAVKYNQLTQCLRNHVISLAEWFHWELSLLVIYLHWVSIEITD